MFSQLDYLNQIRKEKRLLAINSQLLQRSHQLQKQKAELEEEVKGKDTQIKEQKERIEKLEEELSFASNFNSRKGLDKPNYSNNP